MNWFDRWRKRRLVLKLAELREVLKTISDSWRSEADIYELDKLIAKLSGKLKYLEEKERFGVNDKSPKSL